MQVFKKMSLVPKGLKYKIIIAFALMSVIPLMTFFWILSPLLFSGGSLFGNISLSNLSFILVMAMVISILGFFLAKDMIDQVVSIAGDAKNIAEGDLNRILSTKRDDEIGDLTKSLNIMTNKIRENMDDLKNYGEKTKMINIDINRKILALSNLLQVGNLISSSAELNNTLLFILQKIKTLEDDSEAFLVIFDEASQDFKILADNAKLAGRLTFPIKQEDIASNVICIDKNNLFSKGLVKEFLRILELKNIMFTPIITGGRVYGALIFGNRQTEFVFKDDEKELLKIFAKQIAIAIENHLLSKKVKEFTVVDEITGLFNRNFITIRLDEEIKRAIVYQRPCGYLLIDIDNFKAYTASYGEAEAAVLLRALAGFLKGSISEIDKAGRLEKDQFAIVMPEKNKKQLANFAEELRKNIENKLKGIANLKTRVTVSIGVSENPIDGSNADEVMDKADKHVRNAKLLGKNRVVS